MDQDKMCPVLTHTFPLSIKMSVNVAWAGG